MVMDVCKEEFMYGGLRSFAYLNEFRGIRFDCTKVETSDAPLESDDVMDEMDRIISLGLSDYDSDNFESLLMPDADIVVEVSFDDYPVNDDPVLSVVTLAGFNVVSETVSPVMSPVRRDLSALANHVVYYEGSEVVKWEVPLVGAEHLMKTHLPSIQVNNDEGSYFHGGTGSVIALSGVRIKVDGTEAIQFQAKLRDGRVISVLWEDDGVRRVVARGPAYYEKLIDAGAPVYVLLHGDASPDLKVILNPWMQVSRESVVDLSNSGEGVVFDTGGIDYRVRNERVVTLKAIDDSRCIDSCNEHYNIIGMPVGVVGECVDVALNDGRSGKYLRCRSDRKFVDSTGVVKTVLASVVVSDLIQYLPLSELVGARTTDKIMLPKVRIGGTNIYEYRSLLKTSKYWGPYEWIREQKIKHCDSARELQIVVARAKGYCNYSLLWKYMSVKGVYSVGQRIVSMRKPRRKVLLYYETNSRIVYVSDRMLGGITYSFRVLSSRLKWFKKSQMDRLIRDVHGVKYLVCYVRLIDKSKLNKVGSPRGVKMKDVM